jgi:hypothetical protein
MTTANAILLDDTGLSEITHPLTLDGLQQSVGGYIAVAFTIPGPTRGRSITGYVHDEGLLIGLPPTLYYRGQWLVGPCIIVGLDRAGETVGLTADDIAFMRDKLTPGTALIGYEALPVHSLR